jgi:hypothetical protein
MSITTKSAALFFAATLFFAFSSSTRAQDAVRSNRIRKPKPRLGCITSVEINWSG